MEDRDVNPSYLHHPDYCIQKQLVGDLDFWLGHKNSIKVELKATPCSDLGQVFFDLPKITVAVKEIVRFLVLVLE